MNSVSKDDFINIISSSDAEIKNFIKENALALTVSELKDITKKIGRNPTLTEIHLFNIEWSEHCSYKSSKNTLKLLPTDGPNVIQGPKEDAGIIELGNVDGEMYGIVIAHESHNHPSQVVPYEGAATGIGGILRDVLCMGAELIATGDPLRFGDAFGKNNHRTKYIANSVIDGIAGYGNPVGIPNLAGDAYFNRSFDDNCIINVVCLGIVKKSEIIHSSAPPNSEGYDVIIVGKGTDNSGFGGASFASVILDKEDDEANKGAVQVPDPFLKNILIRATYEVFKKVRKKKINVGFKDMGAGGIMCASSELGSSGNVGINLDLDKVHVTMEGLPPYIISCAETQERFIWIVPPDFTPEVLRIYNDQFEIPNVAEGARASVVGKVTNDPRFIMRHKRKVVCDVPIHELTSGIIYNRKKKDPKTRFVEPRIKEPSNYTNILLKILSHPNVASKERIYRHYDTEVRGDTVIRPGEADAGLVAPIPRKPFGVALSTDCNPRYNRIDPYWGAVNAVAESMRNIASIGAVPSGLTDCLCYGNPEIPEVFWQFTQGVKGVADAAKKIHYYNTKNPVPVVSGNVSFYNENANGASVDPSPIIACVGVMKDYSKAVTTGFKKAGSTLYLLGDRKDELGGSVYYSVHKQLGKNVPIINFKEEAARIHAVIEAIDNRFVLSCHDISDGGMITTLSEMAILGNLGAEVETSFSRMRSDKLLFSESPGFIIEIMSKRNARFEEILKKRKVHFIKLGAVTSDKALLVKNKEKKIICSKLEKLELAWKSGFCEAMK